MKRAAAILVFALAASAQTGTRAKPLTNDDVLQMVHQGVPESSILLAIQKTPVRFDVSPPGLIGLHSGGITEPVLNQMIRSERAQESLPLFGVATGSFPVKAAAGKTVRLSAWIRTENVQNGYAGLWWRVDGPGQGMNRATLAFDNSQERFVGGKPDSMNGVVRGATGTTSWTLYQIDLPVGATASNINFGALLTGSGTAWVDGMKVELDGVTYTDPKFDFDFESKAEGFYTGCGGAAGCTAYKVGIDDTVAFSGARSLKFQSEAEEASRR